MKPGEIPTEALSSPSESNEASSIAFLTEKNQQSRPVPPDSNLGYLAGCGLGMIPVFYGTMHDAYRAKKEDLEVLKPAHQKLQEQGAVLQKELRANLDNLQPGMKAVMQANPNLPHDWTEWKSEIPQLDIADGKLAQKWINTKAASSAIGQMIESNNPSSNWSSTMSSRNFESNFIASGAETPSHFLGEKIRPLGDVPVTKFGADSLALKTRIDEIANKEILLQKSGFIRCGATFLGAVGANLLLDKAAFADTPISMRTSICDTLSAPAVFSFTRSSAIGLSVMVGTHVINRIMDQAETEIKPGRYDRMKGRGN